jgi:catechol 2,3-dioxygenase-like lactoylglutathione lyase family enzyme
VASALRFGRESFRVRPRDDPRLERRGVEAVLRDGPRAAWRNKARGRRLHRLGRIRAVRLRGSNADASLNVHIAFSAPDNAAVEKFHHAATAGGYRDNGAPAERPQYHAGYYGAFVLDPDGNNIEVVNHNGG